LAIEKERDLARRALKQASVDDQSVERLIVATEDLLNRLSRRLGRIIGSDGYASLVSRALRVTARQFTFLADVTSEADATGFTLRRLSTSLLGREPAEARLGLVTLLATLIRLLVTLIGDDLAMRLIGQAWPESAGTPPGSGSEERHP
jgi:hypothetical protein